MADSIVGSAGDVRAYVERLIAHPSLPLVAALESARPAVRVWELSDGGLSELATVVAGDDRYAADGFERAQLTPSVAWHPREPTLVVAGDDGLVQWGPCGTGPLDGPPTDGGYQWVAFSPDGRAVWASPSPGDDSWETSDVIDLRSGEVSPARWWDTGVAVHPGGGLVATLRSDQGATLVLFARVREKAPGRMRILDRALILDADGYEPPMFSADGGMVAIRGNAYENSLEVFDFPSLRRLFGTILGDPNPGYPAPPEWSEQFRAWSRHTVAFTPAGELLVGTPEGRVVRVDPRAATAADWCAVDSAVSALAVLPGGKVVVATRDGGLQPRVVGRVESADETAGPHANALALDFLSGAQPVPDEGDIDGALVLTNGRRTWSAADLQNITDAPADAPAWLQLRAFMNRDRGASS